MGIFLILRRLGKPLHGSREIGRQAVGAAQVIRVIGRPEPDLLQPQFPGAESHGVDVVDVIVCKENFRCKEIEFPRLGNDPFPLVARIDDIEGAILLDEHQKTVGLEGPHRKFAQLHEGHLSFSFPKILFMTILPAEGWERIRSRSSSSL